MISRISETVGENEIPKKVERGEPRPESQRFSMRIRGGTKAVKGSLKNIPQNKKRKKKKTYPKSNQKNAAFCTQRVIHEYGLFLPRIISFDLYNQH